MSGLRWLLLAVLSLLLSALAVVAYGLLVYSPLPVDSTWALQGASNIPKGSVTVRFSGTSTLLFSDGDTQWMVDGWFSRPGPIQLLLGKIGPDPEAIERGLAANSVTSLQAVFPVHSHYDHAMDAPEVARRTGALLLGSESTANIARGWGLPETQIQVVDDRVAIQLGKFVITPIESRHFQFPDPEMRRRALADPIIAAPLVPPVNAFDYRLGKAYVLHVSHPAGRWLIVGSAGYVEGALQGFVADTVFLGVGGLGSQTDSYRQSFWQETVATVQATRVIPIHYDSLTAPAEGPFRGPVKAVAFLSGGVDNTLAFLRQKASAHPALTFHTLPRFSEVLLYQGRSQ